METKGIQPRLDNRWLGVAHGRLCPPCQMAWESDKIMCFGLCIIRFLRMFLPRIAPQDDWVAVVVLIKS